MKINHKDTKSTKIFLFFFVSFVVLSLYSSKNILLQNICTASTDFVAKKSSSPQRGAERGVAGKQEGKSTPFPLVQKIVILIAIGVLNVINASGREPGGVLSRDPCNRKILAPGLYI